MNTTNSTTFNATRPGQFGGRFGRFRRFRPKIPYATLRTFYYASVPFCGVLFVVFVASMVLFYQRRKSYREAHRSPLITMVGASFLTYFVCVNLPLWEASLAFGPVSKTYQTFLKHTGLPFLFAVLATITLEYWITMWNICWTQAKLDAPWRKLLDPDDANFFIGWRGWFGNPRFMGVVAVIIVAVLSFGQSTQTDFRVVGFIAAATQLTFILCWMIIWMMVPKFDDVYKTQRQMRYVILCGIVFNTIHIGVSLGVNDKRIDRPLKVLALHWPIVICLGSIVGLLLLWPVYQDSQKRKVSSDVFSSAPTGDVSESEATILAAQDITRFSELSRQGQAKLFRMVLEDENVYRPLMRLMAEEWQMENLLYMTEMCQLHVLLRSAHNIDIEDERVMKMYLCQFPAAIPSSKLVENKQTTLAEKCVLMAQKYVLVDAVLEINCPFAVRQEFDEKYAKILGNDKKNVLPDFDMFDGPTRYANDRTFKCFNKLCQGVVLSSDIEMTVCTLIC